MTHASWYVLVVSVRTVYLGHSEHIRWGCHHGNGQHPLQWGWWGNKGVDTTFPVAMPMQPTIEVLITLGLFNFCLFYLLVPDLVVLQTHSQLCSGISPAGALETIWDTGY